MSERRHVVLVVDDEESMRYFLEKTLKREGYEVRGFDAPAAASLAGVHGGARVRDPGGEGAERAFVEAPEWRNSERFDRF